MTEAKHTELPWERSREFHIESKSGRGVCGTGGYQNNFEDPERLHGENIANAEFIVRACNSYYDMLALAERVANLNKAAGEIGPGMLNQLVDEARRILGRGEDKS